MKLKTLDKVRAIELGTYLGLSALSSLLDLTSDVEFIEQFIKILENHNIDLDKFSDFFSSLYYADLLVHFRTQTLTKEYQELQELYGEITKNTGNLYEDAKLNDPVSIFATYIYMIRKGYFSYNHQFMYSSKMKDFAKLSGLDVVRGHGVCRSIASMLTDIYRQMGMTSYNLLVKTDSSTLHHSEKLCPLEMQVSKDGHKMAEIIGMILPFSNHAITMVENDGINYIFDPTNDIFLKKGSSNHLLIADNPSYYMKKSLGLSDVLFNFLGHFPDGFKVFKKYQQGQKPTIEFDEYRKLYMKAIDFCQKHEDLFEQFYQANKDFIEAITHISDEQRNYIERVVPIVPRKKF